MQSYLIALLICSVTMSMLALFYMMILPLLAKHYSRSSLYYTWLIVVIGLIIPMRPQFNNAVVKVDMPSNTVLPHLQIGNGTPVTAPIDPTLSSFAAYIPWWQVGAIVWFVGVVMFLVYHVMRHHHFLKLTARWNQNITDEQTLELFHKLKAQMGLSRNIGLQFCDSIGSPMMIGFAYPCILLPQADYTKDELYFILKHELVHYKQKDLWYKGLVLIATAIHWFNPVVYCIAKAINRQCELSCDEKVIGGTNADTRLHYCETIIGMIKYQSKRKTTLSTHFYGGKNGMKNRIVSIMDLSKKKAGLTVLCGVLMLTLGTDFAFAVNAEAQDSTQMIQEKIREEIKTSPDLSFAYGFLPDPQIYAQYSSYGITISDDGKRLLYNGQPVRLFVDEHSEVEAFFADDAGTLDVRVTRNTTGNITGIEAISADKAQEYRSAFFADDIEATAANRQDTAGQNKYGQYSIYGITCSTDGEALSYNGQRVKMLVDLLSDGSFETFWFDEAGTMNLSVIRNTTGTITAIESISAEKAQAYQSVAQEYEQNRLDGLEEKVAKKMEGYN